MTTLSRLLSPRTIAVIGGKECERVIEQCDKLGFTGTIWPVHPTRPTMRGRPCLRSVNDLPEPPDAAYVAVNRERSIVVVAALSKMGAGGAVCYAAGFAEADNENAGSGDLQNRLVEAAGDMPIIGPNCYGLINTVARVALWPDQHGAVACESGVAILTQSSNVAINLTMQKRGLPVACVMTVGNQAQQGLSTLGLGLLEDEQVTALGLHIEGLDSVGDFEALALRARELRKPIVVIKVGKSDQARVAALTHTASLAGSDIAHDALFKRLGMARVHSLDAFIETLKLLHMAGPLCGMDLLSLSCSGGEASLMADAAHGRAVTYRPYEGEEARALKKELGDIVTVANPLDYNTFIWGDWSAMTRMFEVALAPAFDLSMLVMDFPREDRCDPDDWDQATDCFIAAVKQVGCRAAIVASLAETMPEEKAAYLVSVGITPLCGLENAIVAAEAAAFIGRSWAKPAAPMLLPHCRRHCRGDDNEVVTLDEHQSKTELAKAGLAVPKGCVIASMTLPDFEVVNIIDSGLADLLKGINVIEGSDLVQPPFALKALGVAHKSQVGALRLALKTRADIFAAMSDMAHLADRFLLEEMAPKYLAELIVGITRDPVCGLMLTLGAGGVLTELLHDTATLLLPVNEQDIRKALGSLRIGRLLDGYRNSEAADIDALIANILCIASYAVNNADTLEELDVNPLIATQFGSVAVDALIIKRKS